MTGMSRHQLPVGRAAVRYRLEVRLSAAAGTPMRSLMSWAS